MLLEICANSFHSAINAQTAGAHRIELCSELAVGGITPSYGLIKKVIEKLSIPVYVLIRPRSGNFTYTEEEFNIMKTDMVLCKQLGCHGIVSGVLNSDNSVDIDKTKELIELSGPLPFTFHRAFDWTPDPFKALEQLIDLGAGRILTSGQAPSAETGMDLLEQLLGKASDSITILPGGGINSENAALFKQVGFSEIHCSASTIKVISEKPKVSMNSQAFFDEQIETYSGIDKIKTILQIIGEE